MNRTDQKLTLFKVKFDLVACKKLTKKTVEVLLNDLFSLEDQAENEIKMEEYADKIGIATL